MGLVPVFTHVQVHLQGNLQLRRLFHALLQNLPHLLRLLLPGFNHQFVMYLQDQPGGKPRLPQSFPDPDHGDLDDIRRRTLDGAVHGHPFPKGALHKIDEVVRTENGLQIDGIVTVSVLYLTADDNQPIQQTSGMIPFSYQIEIPGMHEYTSWRLRHSLEQLGAVMLGGEEAELKAMIHLEVLVMEQLHTEIITNVEAKPYDMEEIEKLPGIVGYIVKKEDSLWKIAKKYYTTIESIREINELTEDRVKAGDRLVLIKKVEEI